MSQLIENGSGWKFREGVADPMLFSLKMYVANEMEKTKLQNFISIFFFCMLHCRILSGKFVLTLIRP